MTITGRYICSVNRYYDKNDKIRGGLYAVLTVNVAITGGSLYAVLAVIVTIKGRSICRANIYCGNNGDIYMQC